MSESIKATEKIKVTFIVKMSNGADIQIDPDEVIEVVRSLEDGKFIRVRQGIINPSFVVAIIKDEQRFLQILGEVNDIERHNKFEMDYRGERKPLLREWKGMQSLADIFADVYLKYPQIPGGVERPRLKKPRKQTYEDTKI